MLRHVPSPPYAAPWRENLSSMATPSPRGHRLCRAIRAAAPIADELRQGLQHQRRFLPPLVGGFPVGATQDPREARLQRRQIVVEATVLTPARRAERIARFVGRAYPPRLAGIAQPGDRKSVVEGKSVSVSVDLGGDRTIK